MCTCPSVLESQGVVYVAGHITHCIPLATLANVPKYTFSNVNMLYYLCLFFFFNVTLFKFLNFLWAEHYFGESFDVSIKKIYSKLLLKNLCMFKEMNNAAALKEEWIYIF